ncbi:MAG: hypothetical protein K1X54_13195 [Flavobacteriales bacterium]|nr:hypothetical protein [Flavobacteriales bacterium]
MKFFLSSMFVLLLHGVNAQVCTGNFVFHTQAEIDQFLIDHPTCTSIDGDVTIEAGPSQTSSFITNVNALQNITEISGSLIIHISDGPFYLSGLSELTTVGSTLEIWDDYSELHLQSLWGLENLASVGGLSLQVHETSDFWVFNNLYSADYIFLLIYALNEPIVMDYIFPGIEVLSGGFTCVIEDASYIVFTGMNNLYYADSVLLSAYGSGNCNTFDAFNNLYSLTGDLLIDFYRINDFVSGFGWLNSVGGNLTFYFQTNGTTYPDLSQLESVGDWFQLYGGGLNFPPIHLSSLNNVFRITITGQFPEVHFDALQSVHDVTIEKNYNVSNYLNQTTFNFPALYSIVGNFVMDGLETITDLSGFPELNHFGTVDIQNCPNLSECAIEAMCTRLSSNPAYVTLNNNATGCNTVDEVLNDCEFCYVSGQVYADLNCDGVFNAGDVHFQNSIIHNQNELPVGSINANGSYYVVIPESSNMQIHSMVPSGFLDGPEYSLAYSTGVDYLEYNFPLCPNLNFHDVRVYGYLESPRPGYACEYSISLKNEVVPTESVLLTLDFTNMPGASVSSTDGTVSGNTVTWTVNDLTFMETNHFVVEFYVDPSTPLGTIYNPVVTATLLSAPVDDDPSDNIFSLNRTVIGSYDPNDKTVNIEAVDVAEIPTDDGVWLDYTIRFQNTGTAEAITVRVEDVITENLDLTTFESLDASHFYEVSFKENRLVEWLFDNIMLPDSSSNEPESHGFIHFRIKSIPGLGITDTIENSVAIYFDFNEPVMTNTAITSFYECAQNAEINVESIICEGSDVIVDASGVWDNYTWTLDANSIGTSNQLTIGDLSIGQHTLSLQVSDEHCYDEAELTIDIVAIPEAPTITRYANVLTASGSGIFEWSMNGEILPDTDNEITITETNVYSVRVIENGCSSELNSGTFDLFVCPAPLQLPQDLSICAGDVLELNVPDEYLSLEWKWLETDEVIGTSADLSFTPTASGTITVSGVSFDCSSMDDFYVTINPIPAAPLVTQAGNTLTATGSGIFEWSMNGEILSDTDNEITITETNVYSVRVIENGCYSELNSGTFDLFVCPAPLQLPQDLSICAGDVLELNVPDEYLSFEWKWLETDEVIGTSADLSFTPTTSGTIILSGVSYDCNSTDALSLVVNPIPQSPTITQEGNTLTASGSGIFEWSMNGEILPDTDNEITITETNVYSVRVIENGCSSELSSATFDYFECPAPLQLPADLSICEGDVVQLNVPDEYLSLEWIWQETGEVIGTTAELIFIPTSSGTIAVSGVSFDCNSSDALSITVNPIPSAPTITQTGNTLTASGTGFFEWSMNGEAILDTDNSIEITESNTYSVSISVNGCESEVASGAFTYTGIEEDITHQIDIYPNPASKVVNLQLPNTGIWHLEIMSSDGQLLHKNKMSGGLNQININPDWCGLLMFKLSNESTGMLVKKKILVVK